MTHEPEALELSMDRRTQDSVLFTTMALSVIAGKVLSSAVESPAHRVQADAAASDLAVAAVDAAPTKSNVESVAFVWPTGLPPTPVQSSATVTPCDSPAAAHLGILHFAFTAQRSHAAD